MNDELAELQRRLATLLAVARVFNAERDEGLLDALVLAPIPRTAIWAAMSG